MKTKILCVILIFCPFVFAQQNLQNEQARILAEELADTISQSLIVINDLEKNSGNQNAFREFSLNNVNASASRLGLLIDGNSNLVLAVTPNQIGSEMGVLVDDEILSFEIDKQVVSPVDKNLAIIMKNGRNLVIHLRRSGQNLKLSSVINVRTGPVWELSVSQNSSFQLSENMANSTSECGYISNILPGNHNAKVNRSTILKINGKSVRHKVHSYRLPVGIHTIEMNESINSAGSFRFDSRNKNNVTKTIKVNVQANMTHQIAAYYIKKSQRTDPRKQDYWKPILWKTKPKRCISDENQNSNLITPVLNNRNERGECGYVSQLLSPQRNKYLFETRIIRIDDKHVTSKNLYKLSPGKHTVIVHEAINDKNLLKFEDKTERRNYKSFEITVEANKNHKIAAKYLKKNERTDARKKDYWEPVTYKIDERQCKL